jgi:hypothetical protein
MTNQQHSVEGLRGRYRLTQYLGSHTHFRLYKGVSDEDAQLEYVCKIASASAYNDVLNREAFFLDDFREEALAIDVMRSSDGGKDPMNYQYLAPKLEDSMIVSTQGDRRVNVYSFDVTHSLGELVPLSMVRTRDRVRIDLKTSAWLLGKYLKMLAFTHSIGVKIGNLGLSNLLAERNNHLVAVFDWTRAKRSGGVISAVDATFEIRAVASAVRALLLDLNDEVPESEQDSSGRYLEYVTNLAYGRHADAVRAHAEFYELVESLWGRTYHPWSTLPLNI